MCVQPSASGPVCSRAIGERSACVAPATSLRDARGDERAGADARHGEAVGDQPLVGVDDGVAAKAGLAGEGAGRAASASPGRVSPVAMAWRSA